MVDQKTIAQKAGVSRATVSRAFTQNANISPKTLAKIQRAMADLGVPPLVWLPTEARKKTKYVLIIAGDISNYFFSMVIKGICDRLQSLGLMPVICDSNYNSEIEEKQIEYADNNDYLGIIFVTAMEHPTLSSLLHRIQTPVVFVNRYIHSFETDTVCIDNYRGGYMAAQHLVENGHRKIAHIASYRGSTPQEDRIRGFTAAIRDNLQAGTYQYDVYYGESSLERGRRIANKLIEKNFPCTALFVADCQVAIGIVYTLQEHGYKVPQDLSVLCFDDSPYTNENGLNLSTINYDPFPMGKMAVDLLMQRLDIGTGSISHVDLMPQLITRSSVLKIGPQDR